MNDEMLTLYAWDDGLSPDERRRVAAAIAADPAVAERYARIRAELDAMGRALTADDEAPATHTVARWHDALDRAAGQAGAREDRPRFHFGSFFWGAVVAASLAVGIGIGVRLAGNEPAADVAPPMVYEDALPPAERSARFARGLQVHLRDTDRELSGLQSLGGTDRQALIMNIIEQNRLYEQAAEQNDAARLARVLRAFELVLMRLAADDLPPAEAAALEARLRFEMNVVLTKLSSGASKEPDKI